MKVEQRFTVVTVTTKQGYYILHLKFEGQRIQELVPPMPLSPTASDEGKVMAKMMMAMPLMLEGLSRGLVVEYDAVIPITPEQYASLGKPTVGDSVVLVVEYEKLA